MFDQGFKQPSRGKKVTASRAGRLSEHRMKRRSSSENVRKVSVYSIVKITRLYDYIKLDT